MLKWDGSVVCICILSALCAIYFTRYNIPIFSTSKKSTKTMLGSLDKRVEGLEKQMETVLKILHGKVASNKDGKKSGSDKNSSEKKNDENDSKTNDINNNKTDDSKDSKTEKEE